MGHRNKWIETDKIVSSILFVSFYFCAGLIIPLVKGARGMFHKMECHVVRNIPLPPLHKGDMCDNNIKQLTI